MTDEAPAPEVISGVTTGPRMQRRISFDAEPVALRSYDIRDQHAFLAWCANDSDYHFLRKSYPLANSPRELFLYLATLSAARTAGRRVWAIAARPEAAPVGHLELKSTDKTEPHEGELVGLVASDLRGEGLGGRAISALLRDPDLAPEFDRVLAVCRGSNIPSITILERHGFERLDRRSNADVLVFGRRWKAG